MGNLEKSNFEIDSYTQSDRFLVIADICDMIQDKTNFIIMFQAL